VEEANTYFARTFDNRENSRPHDDSFLILRSDATISIAFYTCRIDQALLSAKKRNESKLCNSRIVSRM